MMLQRVCRGWAFDIMKDNAGGAGILHGIPACPAQDMPATIFQCTHNIDMAMIVMK